MSESRHLWGLSVSSQLSAAEKTGGGGITDVQMGRLPGRLKSSIGWPGNLHNFLEFLTARKFSAFWEIEMAWKFAQFCEKTKATSKFAQISEIFREN